MFQSLTTQPWSVLWRSALVRLPRAVPTQVLYWTDPEGPYPFIFDLPSRGSHKIPLYIFIKRDLTPNEAESLPVVIDFHGGGFVLGSCLEQAPFCSKMARELDAVVISVDYRMGPVNKFPTAIEDGEDVIKAILEPSSQAGISLREAIRKKITENWKDVCKEQRKEEQREEKKAGRANDKASSKRSSKQSSPNSSKASSIRSSARDTPISADLDPSRVAVSGFSSGGNLALNMGISITKPHHDDHWPSVFDSTYKTPIPLLLYYPSLNSRQLPSERTLPKELPPGNPFWSETSDILAPTYLPRNMAAHPRASPGLAAIEGLHGMTRVLLVLPGLDSLAEQSEVWVNKLADDGRGHHIRIERYPSMKHGWTQMPDGWLNEQEKETKTDIFNKTVEFTKRLWEGDNNVMEG